MFEISKLIKFSPKRGTIFEKLKEELAPGTPGSRVLCPTRWTVRGASLQSITDNRNVLHEVWQASLEEWLDTEVRARICGVLYQISKFEFYFAVRVGTLVLNVADNYSKTLQHSHMTASEGQDIAKRVVKCLETMRSDTDWELFWEYVNQGAKKLDLPDAEQPRKRRRPQKYEEGLVPPEFPKTAEAHYHKIWAEVHD